MAFFDQQNATALLQSLLLNCDLHAPVQAAGTLAGKPQQLSKQQRRSLRRDCPPHPQPPPWQLAATWLPWQCSMGWT